MDGRLANDTGRVLANDVESGENAVATLLSEGVDKNLPGGVGADLNILGSVLLAIVVLVGLAADSRDAEEKLSDELDGAVKKEEKVSASTYEPLRRRKTNL